MRSFILVLLITLISGSAAFAQKAKPKATSGSSGSTFEMTIEKDGQKTEVKSTQFQTADGNAVAEGSQNGRLMLFYGASNTKDEKSFSFQGWISKPEKGTYTIGDNSGGGSGVTVMTTAFNNVPMFLPKSGQLVITAVPQAGGMVEGTFSVVCDNVKDDGTVETYTISGSFKLARR